MPSLGGGGQYGGSDVGGGSAGSHGGGYGGNGGGSFGGGAGMSGVEREKARQADESLGFWGGLGQSLSEAIEGMFSVPDFSSKIDTALALGDPAMLDRAIAEADLAGTNLTASEAQAMTGGIRSQEDSQTGRTSELAAETLRELPFTERLKYAHNYYSSAIPGIARLGISLSPLDTPVNSSLMAAALASALTGNLANMDVTSPDISNTAQGGDPVQSTQQTFNTIISDLINQNKPRQVGDVLAGVLGNQDGDPLISGPMEGVQPQQRARFQPMQQRQITRQVPQGLGAWLGGGYGR